MFPLHATPHRDKQNLQNNELELNAVYIFIEMCVWCTAQRSRCTCENQNTITNMSLLRTQMTGFLSVNIKTRCLFVKFNGETREEQKLGRRKTQFIVYGNRLLGILIRHYSLRTMCFLSWNQTQLPFISPTSSCFFSARGQ